MSKKNVGTVDQFRHAFAVTPHDSNMLSADAGNSKYQFEEAALFIGVGGNLTALPADSDVAVLFKNVGSGQFIPGVFRQVKATGTTCTDIVALCK